MQPGIQISSLKPLLTDAQALDGVLSALSGFGYRYTQLQWISKSIAPAEVARLLEKHGITALGSQDKFDEVINDTDYYVSLNRACGCRDVCISGIPERYEGAEGLKAYLSDFDALRQRLVLSGMTVSMHPVKNDFRLIDGRPAVYTVLGNLPVDIVPDTAQLLKAGIDAPGFINDFAGRIYMIHYKDCVSADGKMTVVGRGVVDFEPITRACRTADVKYLLVEQERWEEDPLVCMKAGLDYIKTLI